MDPTEVASTAAGMISYCCCGVDTCAMHGAQHQRGATAFVCRRCQGSNRKDCTVSPAGDGRASGGVELREKRQRGGKSQPRGGGLS
ncbi:unnamed protein product [Trichogramma brassicae]|uniref:Uncharacterized protein n=1 Tax=Trichogramma brassicae TaxID=86971 RepID=A0A6H5IUM8_9HYME|nr:unnamed protein product [Trichogramma brassicae]